MPDKQASLCELVEDNSARYGIAPRRLWKWALDAIATDILKPTFPEGYSIDGKFDYGGRALTLRERVATASASFDRIEKDISSWWWFKSLFFFNAIQFETWVKKTLRAHRMAVAPKRAAGRKANIRESVKSFIAEKYPHDLPAGVTYKSIVQDLKNSKGLCVSERTVGRALGRP
jgi:hypothetical protein